MAEAVGLRLIRRGRTALLGALPLLFLALAFYFPLWQVLSLGLREEGRWTFSRVLGLLEDPYVRHLLLFTLKQAALSTALSFILGFPLGWFLARYRFPGRRALRSLTLVPFVLPPITVALGFLLFFGEQGYFNRWIMGIFGLPKPPLRLLYTLWAVVLAHAFYNAPLFARFVDAALEGMDPELEEAARVLGAGKGKVFLTIHLPLLSPAILSAGALVFVFCFLSFAIPLSLGGARYATLEVGVYLFARQFVDFPRAASLAIWEILFSLSTLYLHVRGGGAFSVALPKGRPSEGVPFLSRVSHSLWLPYLGIVGLVFLGPLTAVVATSLRVPGEGIGLHWYRLIFSPSHNPLIGASPRESVLTSLAIGGLATAGSLVLGVWVSWILRRLRSPLLEASLMAPLSVSAVILGLALLYAQRWPPYSLLGRGIWAIALAHVLLVYPLVVRMVRPLWDSLDPSLAEVARTLGAPGWLAFLTVELPLLSRGVLVAGAFALAFSLGEMTATAVLARPGMVTIPLAIYRLLSTRRFLEGLGTAAAMAVVLMAVTAGAVFVWEWAGERLLRWSRT